MTHGGFDKLGQPISLAEWARYQNSEYKHVALTQIDYGVVITTWSGVTLDQLFETRVITPGGDWFRRWRSLEEAETGHDEIVKELSSTS